MIGSNSHNLRRKLLKVLRVNDVLNLQDQPSLNSLRESLNRLNHRSLRSSSHRSQSSTPTPSKSLTALTHLASINSLSMKASVIPASEPLLKLTAMALLKVLSLLVSVDSTLLPVRRPHMDSARWSTHMRLPTSLEVMAATQASSLLRR